MEKKPLFYCLFFVLIIVNSAHAALVTIGTATYNNTDYNLIWEENNNGQSIVWLDYSTDQNTWDNQMNWAATLSEELTYNISSNYSIEWDSDDWRLPTTVDGAWVGGFNGTTTAGFNITSSELGHLYHIGLGNLGYYGINGIGPQTGWGLSSTGDFNNLTDWSYWSSTESAQFPDNAWIFSMYRGEQDIALKTGPWHRGIAVREAHVVSTVPEPGTITLFYAGLIGMVGMVRKQKALSFF